MPIVVIGLALVAILVSVGLPKTTVGWIDIVLTIGSLGLLYLRARHPLGVMVATIACAGFYHACMMIIPELSAEVFKSTDPWLPLVTPVVVYNIVLHGRRWAALVSIAALGVLGARPWDTSTDLVLATVTMVVVPALIGLYIGAHRGLVQALTDRAERLEREQHLREEQARADERVRLAAEMHDVVSHRLSLMVLHLGAMGLSATDERTRSAAEELRAAGCEALNELRELVGVLREDRGDPTTPADDEPAPVPSLEQLIAESLAVGVVVDLVLEGNPNPTSRAVGRTAYRVVQESLTNIRKHAPGASATVLVRYLGDRLRLTVRNDTGIGPVDQVLVNSGSRTGLLGLRQRVELVGGSLQAGPREDGGFEVDAILPSYVPTSGGRE
ncbi:sensor histidine kinase [Actinokineospora guangxiensis]|uniref:histidine kinase n=1 Tax=Actinokineospora guangxiensis TaxID=1490288 RepID=A0ABW0ENI4_9PSEU